MNGHAQYLAYVTEQQAKGRAAYDAGLPIPDGTLDVHRFQARGWTAGWLEAHADDPLCGDVTPHWPDTPCEMPTGHPMGHRARDGKRGWGNSSTPARERSNG